MYPAWFTVTFGKTMPYVGCHKRCIGDPNDKLVPFETIHLSWKQFSALCVMPTCMPMLMLSRSSNWVLLVGKEERGEGRQGAPAWRCSRPSIWGPQVLLKTGHFCHFWRRLSLFYGHRWKGGSGGAIPCPYVTARCCWLKPPPPHPNQPNTPGRSLSHTRTR